MTAQSSLVEPIQEHKAPHQQNSKEQGQPVEVLLDKGPRLIALPGHQPGHQKKRAERLTDEATRKPMNEILAMPADIVHTL